MPSATASIHDRICATAVVALAVLVTAHLIFGVAAATDPSIAAFLALLVLVMPRFGAREWFLFALALALAGGLLMRPGGVDDVRAALDKAAYFSAFIVLLMLLREAAITSPSVLTVGAWLTRRPPGQRYLTMWVGAHLAGILMNFGAVSLLAPLIQRGVRAQVVTNEAEALRARTRERRQLNALIRGFSMVVCWAPTTLTQVIIFAAVPGLDVWTSIAIGLSLGAVMLVVGWTEDRLYWGKPRLPAEAPEPFPRAAGGQLLIVYAALISGAVGVMMVAGDITLPQSLMTVAPVMLVGWLTTQWRAGGAPVGARLGQIFSVSIPRMARESASLGLAGFIGITAAKLAPLALIAHGIEVADLPPWAVVALIPAVITLGGQIALSPMMMVVFLGAVFGVLPEMPAPPHFIAIALGIGWSLSMTAAPNATGAMLLAGATGLPPTTLTWRWNGIYALAAHLTFAVLAALVVPG